MLCANAWFHAAKGKVSLTRITRPAITLREIFLNIKFQSQLDLWLVVRKKNHPCWPRMLKCPFQVVLWLRSLMSWKKLHQDLVKLQHSTILVSYLFFHSSMQ